MASVLVHLGTGGQDGHIATECPRNPESLTYDRQDRQRAKHRRLKFELQGFNLGIGVWEGGRRESAKRRLKELNVCPSLSLLFSNCSRALRSKVFFSRPSIKSRKLQWFKLSGRHAWPGVAERRAPVGDAFRDSYGA